MKFLILLLFSILYIDSWSQILDVEGKPVLLPRMNALEIGQINPIPGMVIYNTDDRKFQGFVEENIFVDHNVCNESSTNEVNLSNFSIKIDFASILPDSILMAVDLFTLSSSYMGILALYDTDPCYPSEPIAQTSQVNTLYYDYTRFRFNSPVKLIPNQSYWLVAHSGNIQVQYSCVPAIGINTYSYVPPPSAGPYCSLQNTTVRIRLVGLGEWVDLH